ncbi:MAG: TadE/TadG family type IV pilus assembly protein [Planctomycetota bacterium]
MKRRRGIAATELAISLPLLLLVLIGTMEMCTMIRLKQKLKIMAYEGARVGLLPQAQRDNVVFQCETMANDYRLRNVAVTMSPNDPSSVASGDWFTVSVTAPFRGNSLSGAWTFTASDLDESVSLRKP